MKLTRLLNFLVTLLCLLTLITLAACGGTDSSSQAGTGSLRTVLTDNSTEEYRAVYVTIDRVDVHSDSGGWRTVATLGETFNLLDLVNGVRQELGLSDLPAGHYTQMRLILSRTAEPQVTNILTQLHPFANYLIDQSNAVHELKVPSGFNSGIKIVQGFDINANQTTELLLDFDAMKSVVKAGASGKHLLKPTIKVLDTLDLALVSGLVDDGTSGIEGALVSAQTFTDDLALDAANRVAVIRSTIAAADDLTTNDDESGEYRLALPAGNYNLVAYFNGFQPICTAVNLTVAIPAVQNFTMTSTPTGIIAGTVDITNASLDQHVTIDFRQTGHCDNPSDMINVKTIMVADTGTYSVELPIGDYLVVASADGVTSLVENLSVTENGITAHNIAF